MSDDESHLQEPNKNYEVMQLKTFTKWINNRLKRAKLLPTENLVKDMKNGIVLYNLLKALGLNPPSINLNAKLKIVEVENIGKLLKYLKEECNVKLVNIGPEDLNYGSTKLILGLVWTLILNLSVVDKSEAELKSKVLAWAKKVTANYDNVKVTNLNKSFYDGLAFNAILHYYYPESFDYSQFKAENKIANFEHALDFANNLGIDKLLDIEDLSDGEDIDDKCLFTYLLEYYLYFDNITRQRQNKASLQTLLKLINHKIANENLFNSKKDEILNDKVGFNNLITSINNNFSILLEQILTAITLKTQMFSNITELRDVATKIEEFKTFHNLIISQLNMENIDVVETLLPNNICEKIYDFESIKLANSIENENNIMRKLNDITLDDGYEPINKSRLVEIFEFLNKHEINVEEMVGIKLEHLPETISCIELQKYLEK